MSHKVSLLVIHGIGSQNQGYSEKFQKRMGKRLQKDHGVNLEDIKWGEVYWADILKAKQEAYFKAIPKTNRIGWKPARGFLLRNLADAAAYQRTPGDNSGTYFKIHKRIRKTLKSLDNRDKPLLMIFGHSLGGHIITNYIYDVCKCAAGKDKELKKIIGAGRDGDFMQLKTLCGIVTFGCNIPLFTFALDNPQPVSPRGMGLTAKQASVAKWKNFYDKDDILGYPLRPINEAYKKVVEMDAEINVGNFFQFWNPLSHNGYWDDKHFLEPAAQYISDVLKVA